MRVQIGKRFQIVFLGVIALLSAATPAFADVPLGWGESTSLFPLSTIPDTYGIAVVSIVVIEALVFWFVSKCSLLKALITSFLLNLVSSLFGLILNMITFLGGAVAIPTVVVGPIIGWKILSGQNAPNYIKQIAIFTYAVGLTVAIWGSYGNQIFSRVVLYFIVYFSLLMGFGLTLMIEGWMVKSFIKQEKVWSALLIGNILSYLILAGLYPYFAPNIYRVNMLSELAIQKNIHEGDLDKTINLIKARQDNMQYLLGLRKDNTLPSDYSPGFEVMLLEMAVKKHQHPEIPYAIARETSIRYPLNDADSRIAFSKLNLKQREIVEIHWFLKYYEYCLAASDTADRNDDKAFGKIVEEWSQWYESHKYPDKNIYGEKNSESDSEKWQDEDVNPKLLFKKLD